MPRVALGALETWFCGSSRDQIDVVDIRHAQDFWKGALSSTNARLVKDRVTRYVLTRWFEREGDQ